MNCIQLYYNKSIPLWKITMPTYMKHRGVHWFCIIRKELSFEFKNDFFFQTKKSDSYETAKKNTVSVELAACATRILHPTKDTILKSIFILIATIEYRRTQGRVKSWSNGNLTSLENFQGFKCENPKTLVPLLPLGIIPSLMVYMLRGYILYITLYLLYSRVLHRYQ